MNFNKEPYKILEKTILEYLRESDERKNLTDISESIKYIEMPTVSNIISKLKEEGKVNIRRMGKAKLVKINESKQ